MTKLNRHERLTQMNNLHRTRMYLHNKVTQMMIQRRMEMHSGERMAWTMMQDEHATMRKHEHAKNHAVGCAKTYPHDERAMVSLQDMLVQETMMKHVARVKLEESHLSRVI